ncbi:MAG: 50S ribosomal protein L33 [Clostridiales bacterium]|nr:50S ribosomal protein L33 [Clostridiales bacterium]
MAAKGPRENITLECTVCKRRNYVTSKNKRHNTERLELSKFCKYCNKRTVHKETK